MFFTKNSIAYEGKFETLFKCQYFLSYFILILGCMKMHGDLDTTCTFNKYITNMNKAIWKIFYMC